MPKQVVVRLDDALCDALHRYAVDTERNESQVVRLALRNLLMPLSEPVPLPLPGVDARAPLKVLRAIGGKSSVYRFLEQYGEPPGSEATP